MFGRHRHNAGLARLIGAAGLIALSLFGVLEAAALAPAAAQSAVLLPNGRQQFLDASGNPLAGGSVFMYVPPATTTTKTTWQDAARVTPNSQPITLDSAGTALIYGVGSYRQLVKDALGNTIWDAQTSGLGGDNYGGVSTGSGNAQVLLANDFSNRNGEEVSFTAGFTNTGPLTVNAGFGAKAVVLDGFAGPSAMSGGEVVTNNYILLAWDSVNNRFHLINGAVSATNALNTSLNEPYNLSLSVTAAGGILTVAIKDAAGADPSVTSPVVLPFRSSTAGSGAISHVSIVAPKSQTLSSGSTLGVPSNNTAFRVWLVAFNNAGTVQIGAILCTTLSATTLTQFPLMRNSRASTTAEGGGGAADSAQTFYTSSALVTLPYTVIGFATWESGLAAIGTWTAPTTVQIFTWNQSLPGDLVQTHRLQNGSFSSAATTIPADNTIPQITEGNQILSLPITASSNANIIDASTNVLATSLTAGVTEMTVAMFAGAGVNAIAATDHTNSVAGTNASISLEAVQLGSTSAVTWQVRVGSSVGGGTSTMFNSNGVSGGGAYNGVAGTWLELQEIMS